MTHQAHHADDAAEESLALSIPDDHAGAFVAEMFEDAERSTAWDDVVDALVAPGARDAWNDLSAAEQAVEVLEKAGEYDRAACERFESLPLGSDVETPDNRRDLEEGLRFRRNADTLRDGLADAFASGQLDGTDLEAAIETSGFDTTDIAKREDALETVAEVYDVEFKPYGGTLVQDDGERTAADGW